MKISFLINNIYGIGGTNRTVINLAEALSADHRVEIVSVFRRTAAAPKFTISPQVTVRALVDLRPGRTGADRGHPGLAEPTRVVPRQEEFYEQYSALSDQRIIDELSGTGADVVVGTRPSLNLFVARYTRDTALRVAQEHMTHLAIPATVRAEMARSYPRLDLVTTVTEADARSFREHVPLPALPVTAVPNSVPRPAVAPSDGTRKVIVSAGRMHHVKRYDLLIRAFARLAPRFPDWRLRVYGDGDETAALRTLVNDLDLSGRILLMGGFSPIESEWVKGSIAAVTSSAESFGMTLVEAMRCGLPVVSTDCPVGPREILRDGEDGLLVADGDVAAIAAGLGRLMADDAERARMAAAALRNSQRYDPAVIAARYTELFEEAARRRAEARTGYRAPTAARLGRPPGDSAPPESLKTAVCHVGAPDAGWLSLSCDGPEGPRNRGAFLLRHRPSSGSRLPDLLLDTERETLATGAVRHTAVVAPAALDHLGDGRWRVMLTAGKGDPVHLKAGIRDTRGLIDARARLLEAPGPGPVLWNLPYAQPNGRLMLRTVQREAHAEAREVRVCEDGITVSGVLCGARTLEYGARFVLIRRGRHRSELSLPVEVLGERSFRMELPLVQLVEDRLDRWEDWDWWLQPQPGTRRRVRVCHLFEDFPDVRGAYPYPEVPLPADDVSRFVVVHPSRPVRVRPYCSVSGAMAMNVVDR
ncbi:glycosyltransferase family 4 protein [Streptomyces sp. G-G2]|uniref:glycosyltransferase family 4 protein n=1 Tax=Streptomyces sp. G-G2 TaxID=3046201 RepID=UPI0024B8DD3D|nr:glycosyltransferase family 4 protein [Streptomyces sp. G-G2]MDJ0380245.1 glycosyltransferase family 4 protein [Streptomyces sp. G-G2]